MDGQLDGVPVLRHGEPIPTWLASRLNERYQPALHLAELVLRHASVEAGPGGLPMAAFVVSMWQVFEDFVTGRSANPSAAIPERPGCSTRPPWTIPQQGRVRGTVPMAVDLVHVVGGKPQLIFDAKYKAP